VVDAARTLFLERGYGATTIEAVSAASGVPPATVYRLFSSKRGILKAILDVSIAGDDQPVALPERRRVQDAVADPDPRHRIAAFVDIAAEVNARTAPVYRILIGAASSDPDATALFDDLNAQRRAGQGQLARALDRSGALRSGLRARDAADIIYTLMSPEVYRLLVLDSGWSAKRYARWVTDTLASSLLR